jgi:carbon-monoxide dehydrogenase large subunit/6-hydroxypseudooxynicotine dehydrogenase subunit gamma
VEVDPSGYAVVYTGLTALGQGTETILAQICADTLGVPFEQVSVVHGDTAVVPYGIGSWGSRGTVVGGSAVHLAAQRVREKMMRIAARLLEVSADDLELRPGWIVVRGAPDRQISLAELARAALPTGALKLGERPGLAEEAFFEVAHMNYPYGAHLALVEVDRESGLVDILGYWVAYDVGRAVNPMLVHGQIVGGAAQGLGGALLEELAYSPDGHLLAGSFMDYLLPTAVEVPRVEVLLSEDAPSPLNPLGFKGAGEGGTVGVAAALANAVSDALGTPARELPLTPERVRALAGMAGHWPR